MNGDSLTIFMKLVTAAVIDHCAVSTECEPSRDPGDNDARERRTISGAM